jgi:flavin-dependent dehydrogenase
LRRLGVLQAVEDAGFQRMHRHRAWLGDVFIEGPAGPVGAYSLAPRRIVLDQLLTERAIAAGAEFQERARVEALLFESERVVGASVQRIGGERRDVRARIVVGADGKGSDVAKWVGAPKYSEGMPGRPIYYGYFHGVEPLPEPTVELFFGGNHVAFCMAMRPDEHVLIIEAQPEEFAEIRSDVQSWFWKTYTTLPGMERRLRHATLEGSLLGVKGIDSYFRQPFGPGWVLTGDAGYVKDPVTAYGVGDAMLQGFWLAKALGAWFDGADWEATMSDYKQRRDVAFRAPYEQTLAAVNARDDDVSLDDLRVALTNPQDAGHLLRALPDVLDQAFAPMDRFRHAYLKTLFEAARGQSAASLL